MRTCPECGSASTVTETRDVAAKKATRRRRTCVGEDCGAKFTTYETYDISPLVAAILMGSAIAAARNDDADEIAATVSEDVRAHIEDMKDEILTEIDSKLEDQWDPESFIQRMREVAAEEAQAAIEESGLLELEG